MHLEQLKVLVLRHSKLSSVNLRFPTFTPRPTTGTLTVTKQVASGTAQPSDFTMAVTGNNPSPDRFPGSSSVTNVTIGEGEYPTGESLQAGYSATFPSDCHGTISAGQTKTCTLTNTFTGP
jgi:Prealbumin-like fold domain